MPARDATPRRRFLAALHGKPGAAPVVVCPGGMMSMAVTEVMERVQARWPQAHFDGDAMLRLALAMQRETGFDNVALPFCMTVEAQAYGTAIEPGDAVTQPRVKGELLPPDGRAALPEPDFGSGRARIVLEALAAARRERPDVALIGNLVGPVSLLGMLADPLQMLRWTRKAPAVLHDHLTALTERLVQFGRMQVAAGADAVCVADPTATGEILGGARFREFALPYLLRIADGLHEAGTAVIVHICGNVATVLDALRELPADAVSFDSMVDIAAVHAARPPWRVMGNLSAFLLESGPERFIGDQCRALVQGGVRLVAPACGVVPGTPAAHLRAMRAAVPSAGC